MRAIFDCPEGTREQVLDAAPFWIGDGRGHAAAAIAAAGGRPFVQPLNDDVAVFLDHSRLGSAHWIGDGQRLTIGDLVIDVGLAGDRLMLGAEREPPDVEPGHRDAGMLRAPTATPVRRQHRVGGPLVLIALILLGVTLWYVFSARMVYLQIEPAPDRISLDGRLPALPVGQGYLAQPGSYTVSAQRRGYRPLSEEIEVGSEPAQRLTLRLDPLPGYVSIDTPGVTGAEVIIDGEPAGHTPLNDLELEAGEYALLLRADRYLEREETLHVEGLGIRLTLSLELTPGWAEVHVDSQTPSAELWVDGEAFGPLPMTAELAAGVRELEVRAAGHKPWRDRIEVLPDRARTLRVAALEAADGSLRLTSRPTGANVTVDGRYAGRTPLTLALTPDQTHEIRLSKRGYRSASRDLSLIPEEQQELRITLRAEEGAVRLRVEPDDATLFVEGRDLGVAHGTHALPAVPQLLEVRREGFEPAQVWVTPRPGLEQTLTVTLRPEGTPATETLPERFRAPDGSELVLIRPGAFTMGASRRDPGRRANETLRHVELTRPYYLATTEVTNAQFRRFKPEHESGRFQSLSLGDARQPVVNVAWVDAAAYCGWLNEQAGTSAGYRLPTEAEWAWAARHAGRATTTRFPWGDALPPPAGSGNFADRAVSGVLAGSLDDYDDGYSATAPPGSFTPDPSGIFDLAGNVAEWVNDFYAIQPTTDASANRDPSGPADGKHHVIRGSSWMQASVSALRWTYRDYGSEPRPDVGFRCARDASKLPGR